VSANLPANDTSSTNRRHFLQTSAAAATALSLSSVPFVHAGGNDTLRVGLVGCGGRGTGAAVNALNADPNVRLVAMGDAFQDRIDSSLAALRREGDSIVRKMDVPRERQFVGFDAFQRVIDNVDVVLLCTPPHFRPAHIEAAVQANKHIFAEKPVAVDAPGVRRVLAACQRARQRNLSVVSGLCWRYHPGKRATFARIHDGAVGDIVAMQCNYLTGGLWHRARVDGMTDMQWQMRNWLYFTWLSGDFNVEQHVHSLDKMAWAMRDQNPVKCYGLGGRQVRTGADFGHIFDHMSVVYEYANGVKAFSFCRQQEGCYDEVKDYIWGSRGYVDVMDHRITGANAWRYPPGQNRNDPSMYQVEHNELFAAIRNGNPINNGEYMCKSTMMAIMGREACYTGAQVTWENAYNSDVVLGPRQYDWNARLEVPAVALPGA
jgi:predicted dehydrogenase